MDFIGGLPLEISTDILGRLDAPDLIMCSSVCKLWRRRINSDSLWKKYCLDRGWSTSVLDKFDVSHTLINTVIEDSLNLELSPLCKWRKAYNLNQRLTRNWTNEKYIKYSLSFIESPVFCLDCDGVTAVTGHENGNIVVWNVRSIPYEMQIMDCVLPDFPVLSIKTDTTFILAVQKKLLQIYKYSDGYKLIDLKSFELGDDNIEVMQKLSRLGNEFGCWYNECLRFNDTYSSRKLHYISLEGLLYANCTESSIIYVWNLHNGKKDSLIMMGKNEIKDLEVFGESLFITVIDKGMDSISLLEYKPKTRNLKKLVTSENTRMISVSEHFLLGVPSTEMYERENFRLMKLKIWLKNSLELIAQKEVGYYPITAVVSGSNQVIYSQYSDITVWDPVKGVTLTCFSTGGNVGFIRIGYSNFLLVFMNASVHIWDWKHGHRLYRLYSSLDWTGDFRDLLWISDSTIIVGGVNNQLEMVVFL